jgi:hypothetical protein
MPAKKSAPKSGARGARPRGPGVTAGGASKGGAPKAASKSGAERTSTSRGGAPRSAAPKGGAPRDTARKSGEPASSPKPFSRGPATPKSSPKDKKRALEVEKEFGKDIRRAAERSGRKPATWRESERHEAREVVLNRIGSVAVQRATTRTWEEWVVTLDAEGMRGKEHRDVVGHLLRAHELTSWWAQMVSVGYEQSRGQRVVHEPATGFEVSVSRSLEASASDVFRAFNDPARRNWSTVRDYIVRTTIAPRSLRLGMPDGTLVSVAIDRKGNTRCTVTVQQTKLADNAATDAARSYWRDALARLADMLAD